MKNLFIFLFFAVSLFSVKAQTDVYLKINHQLANSAFALNQVTTTNSLGGGTQYKLTRLEYYLSGIVLTHDSGQQTKVPNRWILVDPTATTNELIGNLNINKLESISFAIGVDSLVNHNDPSLLPNGHALAPKSPSMHWGWAGGYRFVALEGRTGTNLNQQFEIHAIGDKNYQLQTLVTTGYPQNGDLIIECDADYNQALNGIDVNSNLLYHGEDYESATLLSNFKTSVFTLASVGLTENKNLVQFDILPNPSTGRFNIHIDPTIQNLSYVVFDLTGREMVSGNFKTVGNIEFTMIRKGIFMLTLYKDGELVGNKKIVVN